MLNQKKPFYKKWWFILIAIFFILGAIGAAIEDEESEVAKEETTTPVSKQVTDEEKENEKKKAKDEEKAYYEENTRPFIDSFMKDFDEIWATHWTPTFEGLGNGEVDQYTAYDTLKNAKARYDVLYDKASEVPVEKLSKKNKEKIIAGMDEYKKAAMNRGYAIEKAMKIVDEKDYSPSRLDEAKTDIEFADSEMMKAAVEIIEAESDLGVER